MPQKDVLVVEDDPELNELVGAYVQIAGFGYRSAMGGNDALQQAQEHSPALILLDVMLPDVDGFEVCRRLKREQGTRNIPVVMLTALDREDHRMKGLQCGAVSYLTKPFDPEHLMNIIRDKASRNGNHTP